ncbi:MAG TPA: GAF and ANTAR domain-containing protein [Gaiellales bacterium]|jgi:GAF domain-containing protein|nr:GAF and ANTAR domain-containing protein [Gaiellales bacterium]
MSDQPGADAAEVRLNRLLNLILETAVEALGFSAATVTARHTNDMSTVAATDQRLIELDAVQYEDGGPCVQTLDDPSPILLEDASKSDDRWQHFAQTAAHLGVRSSLSLHVPTDSRDLAASLNLYARETFDMSRDNVRLASTYAAQLAATLESVDAYRSTARLAQNLAEAMRSRAVIEQAKGILMADYQINDAEAFQRLAELSQRSNIKLRDVAARFVEERSSGG